MRRAMLLVIDSLHPKVLKECLNSGKVPALAFLGKHGRLSTAVSTFPTMTPTASATIATGVHCDLHHVPGFIWYDNLRSRYVNYGASLRALLSLGPVRVFSELFYNLNDEHLNPHISTIYEELHRRGISSACINFFIRRGPKVHTSNFHWLMKIFTAFGLKRKSLLGPESLVWGETAHPKEKFYRKLPHGIFNKFGFNDKFTSEAVCHLIQTESLPEFTIAYFPDNDRYSHVYGPLRSHPSIISVDEGIGHILSSFGSWERALRGCHFVVVGDHAQSFVGPKNTLHLDEVLKDYRLSPGKIAFGSKGQLIVSVNERMAIIDFLDKNLNLDQVAERLSFEKNIGLVMWKKNNQYHIIGEGKKLSFVKNGSVEDGNGLKWEVSGELSVIGAYIEGTKIRFGAYPDAFERISAALDYGTTPKILLSAPLGWEYFMPGAPTHPGGGSHGSLHRQDSVVPVISAGQGEVFAGNRTADIKEHILNFFQR